MDYRANRLRFCQAFKVDNSGWEVRFVVTLKYMSMFETLSVFTFTVLEPPFCYRESFRKQRRWHHDLFVGKEVLLRVLVSWTPESYTNEDIALLAGSLQGASAGT